MSKTIAEHLTLLGNTKLAIQQAIIAKGVAVSSMTEFSDYPAKIASIPSGSSDTYTRPTDWLTLPTITMGQEKFVGLYAIFNSDSNFIAFKMAGAYNVDWGDGTTGSYASGAQAEHKYTYSSIADSTLCSRGYKQVIVTITMKGDTFLNKYLSIINIDVKHSQTGLSKYTTGWLDIKFGANALAQLEFAKNDIVGQNLLEQVAWIGSSINMKSCNSLFKNCSGLINLASFNTSNVTNFYNMFYSCYALKYIPQLDTSKGTSCSNMFQDCSSLQTIPQLNTSNCTNFSYMFEGCSSLRTIPQLNTSKGTSFSDMFEECNSLQTIPLLDTSKGVEFDSMFSGCNSLQMIPLLDTSNGTDFTSMFGDCPNLQTIPQLNISKGTDFRYMFRRCRSLQYVPTLNTSAIVEEDYANQMFSECYSLQKVVLQGMAKSFSVAGCRLAATDLVDLFNGLATVTGKTITVANVYGYASLTDAQKAIATGKGWTISTTAVED